MQNKILDKLQNSRFLGLMLYDFTDIFVINHLIVFISFITEGFVQRVFVRLLYVEEGQKDTCIIFETLIRNMNESRLNFDK